MDIGDRFRKHPLGWIFFGVTGVLVFLGTIWGMVSGKTVFELWDEGGRKALTIRFAIWLVLFLFVATAAIQIPWLRKFRLTQKGIRPMTLIFIALIGAAVGTAIWWFLPIPPDATPAPQMAAPKAPPKIKTLHELYKTDFPAFHKSSSSLPASSGDGKVAGRVEFAVCFDLSTNSKFLTVYIPHGLNAAGACEAVARDYNTLMLEDAAKNGLTVIAKAPGETGSATSSDLVFTGKIYIYHEEELSLAELARLDALFREKKTSVHFRGQDYVTTSFLRERGEGDKGKS